METHYPIKHECKSFVGTIITALVEYFCIVECTTCKRWYIKDYSKKEKLRNKKKFLIYFTIGITWGIMLKHLITVNLPIILGY